MPLLLLEAFVSVKVDGMAFADNCCQKENSDLVLTTSLALEEV